MLLISRISSLLINVGITVLQRVLLPIIKFGSVRSRCCVNRIISCEFKINSLVHQLDEACHRTKCMVFRRSSCVNVSHSQEALSIKTENTLTNHKKLSSFFCFFQKHMGSEFNMQEKEHPNYNLDILKVL